MTGISKWIVAATLVLCLHASPARAQTQGGAPQPLGKLVDVGGYRVHLYCTGSGSPTVVITGSGYSFDWMLVQPEVAKFTRICAYDHSGGAWSDPGPADTCSLRVGEIHAALRNASITGPYVLVGHSLGALVSRLYANEYQGDVAGMVIVDHTTGPAVARVDDAPGAPARASALPSLPYRTPDPNAGFEKLPERYYRLHVWANSQPSFPQAMRRNVQMAAECRSEVESTRQNRTSPLGGKPLIALSSPGTQQFHATLLGLSSNSKQVIAANSGHYVMVDRPDVVIEAIREVVDAARNRTRLKK